MRLAAISLAVLAGLAQPAQADLASFEFAFTQTCLRSIPHLTEATSQFMAESWDGYDGAGPGEYEFYKDTTQVFLAALDIEDQPGCTVMDSTLSPLEAKWILELALGKYFPGKWETAEGYDGQPVWLLNRAGTTTHFYINEGQDGGAAIAFEVRQ